MLISVDISADSKKTVLCTAFFEARGGKCAANEECVIFNDNPLCE